MWRATVVLWWFLTAALLLEANLSLLDISAVMSSNFTGAGQIYEQDLCWTHLYALAENASCGPYSPMPHCRQVQLLIKANFRDTKLMSPRVPLQVCSSRRLWTALQRGLSSHWSQSELGSWAASATANSAASSSLISYLHAPRKEIIISQLSNGDIERGNVYSHRASCRHTNQAGKTHQLAAVPLHQALLG